MIYARKISDMGKEQKLLLQRSMSKKAYNAYCRKYRSTMLLGRNYGTRQMASKKDPKRINKVHIVRDNMKVKFFEL